MSHTCKVIFDNAGGTLLQLHDDATGKCFARRYDDAEQAAEDFLTWWDNPDLIKYFEGHDPRAMRVSPTTEQGNKGQYRWLYVDWDGEIRPLLATLATVKDWGTNSSLFCNLIASLRTPGGI